MYISFCQFSLFFIPIPADNEEIQSQTPCLSAQTQPNNDYSDSDITNIYTKEGESLYRLGVWTLLWCEGEL